MVITADSLQEPPELYDPLAPEALTNPYAGYRNLRDHDPVHHHHDPSFFVLSRFIDIWDAVRQPAVFSSAQGITFWGNEIEQLGLAPTIVMLDPPRHSELRRLISRGLTQRRVADLEGAIRTFVRDRIADMERRVADGETVDLHRELSSPLPTFVLSTLLGVPDEYAGRFDVWVRALVQVQDQGVGTDHDPDHDPLTMVAEMYGAFSEIITARRAEPGDDLISALTQAEIDGVRLTDWDILGFCFVMVAGGNDTTATSSRTASCCSTPTTRNARRWPAIRR